MNNLRGIGENLNLIEKFKQSKLYELLKANKNEFLTCIRDNEIAVYYNSDRVAKVYLSRGQLKCKINTYYMNDSCQTETDTKSNEKVYRIEDIVSNIDKIKRNSDKRCTPEKKAQQAIVSANNANPNSEWFCFDIEYRQSQKVQQKDFFTGRFDILAISKKSPHRLAVIELKYNTNSIDGKSGIVKHINDFKIFTDSEKCILNLKNEARHIIADMKSLDLPSIHLEYDQIEDPKFYVICLYDTEESSRGTVGAYLFNYKKKNWGIKRVSKLNVMDILGEEYDIESPNCPIKLSFLFKQVKSPIDLGITDILNAEQYDKE